MAIRNNCNNVNISDGKCNYGNSSNNSNKVSFIIDYIFTISIQKLKCKNEKFTEGLHRMKK